jgi:hypothetical protein
VEAASSLIQAVTPAARPVDVIIVIGDGEGPRGSSVPTRRLPVVMPLGMVHSVPVGYKIASVETPETPSPRTAERGDGRSEREGRTHYGLARGV